jgi:hypothetical protein
MERLLKGCVKILEGNKDMTVQIATTSCQKAKCSDEQIGIHATALGLTEVGIGSVMHAFHIPFAGHLLSLNQIFILTHSLCKTTSTSRTFSPFSISTTAALIKCSAPIGKKLTPMLAICMQGSLYNIGILCFGNSLLGRWMGGMLSSMWGFFQPLLLYWLFFGSAFFQATTTFTWVKELFYGLIVAKAVATSLIVFLTPLLPAYKFTQYFNKVSGSTEINNLPSMHTHPIRQALSDLCKPSFLFSLFLTAFFFYFSQGISQAIIWGILRPLGIGILCFYMMRLIPLKRWLTRVENDK